MRTVHAIIVHASNPDQLDRCLRSLVESRGVELDIVVVANGPGVSMPAVIESEDRIRWVELPLRANYAEANNQGARWAALHLGRPDFYYFLNDDTRSEAHSLAALVDALVERPGCCIAGPRLMMDGTNSRLNSLGLNLTLAGEAWDEGIGVDLEDYGELPGTRSVLAVTGAALLIRSDAFEALHGWREIYEFYYEDVDLALRARSRGWDVVNVPSAVVWHAISASSTHWPEWKKQLMWRNRWVLVLACWPWNTLAKLAPLLIAREILMFGVRLLGLTFRDAGLQLQSWIGVAKRIPLIREARSSRLQDTAWVSLLRPVGSAPEIDLSRPATDTGIERGASRPGSQRILVCGVCPLPFEDTHQSYGTGIRTWQFAQGLARAGHRVRLVAMVVESAYRGERPRRNEVRDGVEIERYSQLEFMAPEAIRRVISEHRADAVVGASIYGSYALTRAQPALPFWADQFGHVMAEAQAKAQREDDNWPIAHFWNMASAVGQRADMLSTVSERQRYAAIGELGALGRLTNEASGYDFTAVVPCAVIDEERSEHAPVMRGVSTPADAFIVLWSGGYNVWCDVETIFRALEMAMARCPSVHFVSTGGAIPGQDEDTYECFAARTRESPYKDRYHLEGWVVASLVPAYTAEADLGVIADLPIYEGLLGSKNRIVQWMSAGLPVAYNRVGDIGDLLAERQLGLTFEEGDPEALARQIIWATENREPLAEIARRAQQVADRELSIEATTRPLTRWARDPRHAPGFSSPSVRAGRLGLAWVWARVSRGLNAVGRLKRFPLARRLGRWWVS
jgi:GT2 family glycosyltransferase